MRSTYGQFLANYSQDAISYTMPYLLAEDLRYVTVVQLASGPSGSEKSDHSLVVLVRLQGR